MKKTGDKVESRGWPAGGRVPRQPSPYHRGYEATGSIPGHFPVAAARLGYPPPPIIFPSLLPSVFVTVLQVHSSLPPLVFPSPLLRSPRHRPRWSPPVSPSLPAGWRGGGGGGRWRWGAAQLFHSPLPLWRVTFPLTCLYRRDGRD